MRNKKLFSVIIAGSIILIVLSGYKLFKSKTTPPFKNTADEPRQENHTEKIDGKKVSILSTNPDPLNETIIQSDQTIEITFSNPIENTGEFKHRIEPKPDYKLELTQERKTIKIIPVKPFELGITFTLFISPETKFDGGARLSEEKNYHFKTVKFIGF